MTGPGNRGFSKTAVAEKFRLVVFLFILFSALPVCANLIFSDLDISEDNKLLFRLNASPGDQNALFISDVQAGSIRRLTAYPENMTLIENGRTLLVQNALGSVRVPVRGGLPVDGFPTPDKAASSGSAAAALVSPNGRWVLSIEPLSIEPQSGVSRAYGNLVLEDVVSGEILTIASGVERLDNAFPASWSFDSQIIIYSLNGGIYYYMVNSTLLIDEKFRYIGEGTINSVVWDRGGDFYYLLDSAVYRVRGMELFTRTFYADFLDIGTAAGRIPFHFDSGTDRFWIAPDAGSIALLKGKVVFFLPLDTNDYRQEKSGMPNLVLPRSSFNIRVLWVEGGLTVLASVRQGNTVAANAWRLDSRSGSSSFVKLNSPPGTKESISPDGRIVMFWGNSGVILYDYANWNPIGTISTRPVYSCIWIGNNEIITGDSSSIQRIVFFPGEGGRIVSRDLICISGASSFGFESASRARSPQETARIIAHNNGVWYVTDGRNPWAVIANPQVRQASQISNNYRVFLERRNSGPYENIPMFRNISSVGTFPLLTIPPSVSANGTREIGICFDLYDDLEGLAEVLDALDRRGMKATFFLGGEFIRRYPQAAKDIADSGHEAASLFFAPIDLSDARYQIDTEFINRGLARNEDEFFNATGKELALIWHPPWYAVSPQAILSAARAGYRTTGRDVDPFDWVSLEDSKKFNLPQYSAADMVDRVMSLAGPGLIIPIRLGFLQGGRSDYLFHRINVLLDALVREGYMVVPVSQLSKEHGN